MSAPTAFKDNKDFKKHFDLPNTEGILHDFSCAYRGKMLRQGKMYITPHYICFYSSIFGNIYKKYFSISDIESIEKTSTMMVPNTIKFRIKGGKEMLFANFLQRDFVFDVIQKAQKAASSVKKTTEKTDTIVSALSKADNDYQTSSLSEQERLFRIRNAEHNDTIRKIFQGEISSDEYVLDHAACAHLGKVLKQGRLYITPKFILFYANLLGSQVKKVIPFSEVIDISKESDRALAANPIEIHLKWKRFTFCAFMNRETTLKNLKLQWQSNKEGSPLPTRITLEDEDDDDGADRKSKKGKGEGDSLINNGLSKPVSVVGGSEAILVDNSAPIGGLMMPTSEIDTETLLAELDVQPKEKKSCGCFPCFQ
eukprot:TRINITY_DN207_c0_g1_i2.p1 TRINITY_DN207_c0_g1~~TRINITY_DN207_c0_g1_i2.p1  ORF type:complete len:368 (-),score=57.63 TRINITY_DN207_c0_g1_i2:55-1158(-)